LGPALEGASNDLIDAEDPSEEENSTSYPSSSRWMGCSHTSQSSPSPRPAHILSGFRPGSFPFWIAARALRRRSATSIVETASPAS
jgi:hypothetical protein